MSELAQHAVDRLGRENAHAVALGRLVSIASRIEPGLLRRVRLDLLPAADASAEADLWLSSLVQSRSASAMMLLPDVADLLRGQLASDLGRLDAAREVVRLVHAQASPLLALEEDLVYWGVHPDQARALPLIEERLLQVVAAMRQSDERAHNLAAWAARALPRLPARIRDHDVAHGLALAATALVAAPRSFERAAPSRATLQLMRPFVKPTARVAVALRRVSGGVEVQRGGTDADWHALEVQAPPIIYVGGQGVAVAESGVTRIAVAGDVVDVRDVDGRGWRLEPHENGDSIRRFLARVETRLGRRVAYLIGSDIAATSASLVARGQALTLEFPIGSMKAHVVAVNTQHDVAILRLDDPRPSGEWLQLGPLPRSGATWRVFSPESTGEPTVLMGTILEASAEQLQLASERIERPDLVGAPIIVAGRVVGHVSAWSITRSLVGRPATAVESLLEQLAKEGDARDASRGRRSGLQYLVVSFPASRSVMIDGVPQGRTNTVIQIEAGLHAVTLTPPADFTPLSQTVEVAATSPLNPVTVTFRPASPSGASTSEAAGGPSRSSKATRPKPAASKSTAPKPTASKAAAPKRAASKRAAPKRKKLK